MKVVSPRSLTERVARTTAAAIAAGAAFVAVVTLMLADRFAQAREEQHLTDAAAVLAYELAEPGADPSWVAADEAREQKPTKIRVAVYRTGLRVAGDAQIPRPPAARGCLVEGAFTSCSFSNARFQAIAARDRAPLIEKHESMLLTSVLAVFVTSSLGALAARRIAQAVISPLSRLAHAVARVSEVEPDTANLGEDVGLVEVDVLRDSLRATLTRLGHSLATSRRFAADAAHELRTPLTVIIGQLQLSASAVGDEAEIARERALRAATRLATLVNRLLVLATPAAKLEATEVLDLHAIVDDALDRLPPAAWPRVVVTPETNALVRGDRDLLATMVANALENALKFSAGPVHVALTASAEVADFRVADDGPGIPEAERQRVFEPFFRMRASRASSIAGHGIGLALIAHVAAVHGGSAHFERAERGSRLVMTLPRVPSG